MREFFNTLENLYTRIFLVQGGWQTENIDAVWKYYKRNENIRVFQIEAQNVENRYIINISDAKDSICVFGDMCKPKNVTDENGTPIVSIFLNGHRKVEQEFTIINRHFELDNIIIPKLRESGVRVLKVFSPEMKGISGHRVAKYTMKVWTGLRKISPKAFGNLRHIVRGSSFLKADQENLTNDFSKGYSIMYGNGRYINFDDGFRRTVGRRSGDKLEKQENNIYFFGPCFIRGLAQEDAYTIPSLIQQRFPQYKVWNYGSEFGTINLVMRLPDYKPGDIAIIFVLDKYADRTSEAYDLSYDMSKTWKKVPHIWRHIFDDPMHYDNVVHNQLTMDIGDVLENMIRSAVKTIARNDSDQLDDSQQHKQEESQFHSTFCFGPARKTAEDLRFFNINEDLTHWIDHIDASAPYVSGIRGAIVMNCNPFTRGHKYLIETAKEMVDELMIFILQEDKSHFAFQDRLKMVELGVADMDGVKVFPGGYHIISNQTLPGYFNKNELRDTVVDLSRDLDFFVKIAKTLQISIRFAGSEPLDPFTDRYNKKMAEFLPKYGIQFVEIERIKAEGKTISASRVRECMKEKRYEELKNLVPISTYMYLSERYFDKSMIEVTVFKSHNRKLFEGGTNID